MTIYPFDIAESLRHSLPERSDDGLYYTDVKFRGGWDGILVIDADFRCIGVYAGRTVKEHPLPFDPDEIQDFRPPCVINRILASLPQWFDFWIASLFGVIVASPLLLIASSFISVWIAILVIPVAGLSIMGMYSCGGFPFIRLPVALAGLMFMISALLRILRHTMGSG